MPDFTSLMATLVWLAGPAGIVAWLLFVSDTVRNWREDGELTNFTPLGLQLSVAAASFLVPAVAYGILLLVPPATIETLQPFYSFVATFFLAYIGQKIWFRFNK